MAQKSAHLPISLFIVISSQFGLGGLLYVLSGHKKIDKSQEFLVDLHKKLTFFAKIVPIRRILNLRQVLTS